MLKVFSLRDNKAEAFNRPFFNVNEAVAGRELQAALAQDDNMAAMAGDLTLYVVGTFDPTSGRLTPCDPKNVLELNELLLAISQEILWDDPTQAAHLAAATSEDVKELPNGADPSP